MSRETKIFLTSHLYPVYLVCHLQFADGCRVCTGIFNIMPGFFVSLFLYIWLSTSHIRLSQAEKRSIVLFIYFFVIIHLYYAICSLIYKTLWGKIWIINHNAYIVYFIIFMVLFYFIYRERKRRD